LIVVDTSVLVDLFRGRSAGAADQLREMERQGVPFTIPAVCCQELLQGARDDEEWKLLLSYLESQRLLLPGDLWTAHREAARIFFDCRRIGVTVRSTIDCFIAQLVLEHQATLLHHDEDFERIRRVRPLRTILGP
jgi:predicted nucleic acid-binding protein